MLMKPRRTLRGRPVQLLLLLLFVAEQHAFYPAAKTRQPRPALLAKDDKKKEELVKEIGEEMKRKRETESSNRLLDQINPFRVGQTLRRTIDRTLNARESAFYLDEKVGPQTNNNYVPEVLVIGATSPVGILVVRQLLKTSKLRVLVQDLYTKTLETLGTDVTYCQGDLENMDSLEYATTDVDKIVVVSTSFNEQHMNNVIRAYQNVRHADYGTSQAAKRSLFKFQNSEDFVLFNSEDADWSRNQFDHGVFKGTDSGEVTSSRLRSREEPDNGIDFWPNFAGFICRICGDGNDYEAFVRTGDAEYVCGFSTRTKNVETSKSRNKFTTIRLAFDSFTSSDETTPPFTGKDVRYIGFRFRGSGKFYLAFTYIKLYRAQPEPEFVYLSDARVPNVVKDSMIRAESRQLVATDDAGVTLYDETAPELHDLETVYSKFVSEAVLKQSGLSYCIIRVADLTDDPMDSSNIQLSSQEASNVSRTAVAEICAKALLDPNALNKSFYVSQGSSTNGDLSQKFASIISE